MIRTFLLGMLHRYLQDKHRYKNSDLPSGPQVDGVDYLPADLQLGRRSRLSYTKVSTATLIGDGTAVYQSSFEEGVTILDDCIVVDAQVGPYVKINNSCHIEHARVDAYTYIAVSCLVQRVSVGKFCSIGPNVMIGGGIHPTRFVSTSPVFFSTGMQCGQTFASNNLFEETADVRIGNDVWIGAKAFIRDGVSVGNGAIIAAGAIVTKDVADYAIVGGVPAKLIRHRFDEPTVARLLSLKWWDWPVDKLKIAQPRMANENIQAFLEWADTA